MDIIIISSSIVINKQAMEANLVLLIYFGRLNDNPLY